MFPEIVIYKNIKIVYFNIYTLRLLYYQQPEQSTGMIKERLPRRDQMEGNIQEIRNTQQGLAGGAEGRPGRARSQVYDLMLTGLMAALVMAATSFFRIPVVATNGYVHLGDAMVFLSVFILGRKNGAIAGASGSALADLLGGYAHWAPWTFIIKGLMAFVFGTILAGQKKDAPGTLRSILAMTAGSLIMIAGYFIVQRFMYGNFAAPLAALPGNIVQAAAGVTIAEIASAALKRAKYLS